MKTLSLLLSAGVLILASCSTSKQQNHSAASNADTVTATNSITENRLTARMAMNPVIQSAESLLLRFTVYNHSANNLRFCKWHTPFEPPMSKYLDIKDEQGIEAEYRGVMAKRVMPPPAESYIEVRPGDSLSVKVDLSKVYLLGKPGKYTVRYNAQEISGLSLKDSVNFIYKK